MDKPNEFELGRQLKVGSYKYSDLDELVFSHVKGMARKVEEMLSHDKYKGDEDVCCALASAFLPSADLISAHSAILPQLPAR